MKDFDADHFARQLKQDIEDGWIRRRSVMPTLVMAIVLIVAGVLLFLSNVGWLPLHNLWQYWPLIMIAGGISKWLNSSTLYGRTWAVLIVGLGVLYLGLMLGVLHIRRIDGSWTLSLAFIVFGIAALARALDPALQSGRKEGLLPGPRVLDQDALNETAILGSLNRRVESTNFKGGLVTALLGNVELDLRRAIITNSDRTVRIEVVTLMGAVKLRIPETWRLGLLGTPILGSYEDKTIPQARVDSPAGVLMLTGTCIMGSVEVEN